MNESRGIQLKHLHGRLTGFVYELTKVEHRCFQPADTWTPAINAYRCPECVLVCVELAGVDRDLIDLRVEEQRLIIRGTRRQPGPGGAEGQPVRILALEIDHGQFERKIELPSDVDPERVRAEQRNGLLCIYLPLRAPA